jgi:hypothetical protein
MRMLVERVLDDFQRRTLSRRDQTMTLSGLAGPAAQYTGPVGPVTDPVK